MEANEHGALTLVRLVGAILLVATVLETGLYWAECSLHKPAPVPMQAVPILLRTIPALLGIVVLIKSRAIAEWVADKLDL
ncbi:MAG TPA: hypothetical protein VG347_24715 [Verrucomicrobiae bacterium]|nr:hypothetical protein [Verrucomicrobiae bacterium]